MTAEEFLNSEEDLQPARLMEYGPIAGEYHRDAMIGPRENRLTPVDVAAAPDYGFNQGDLVETSDGSLRRVADLSYRRPGVPNHHTIELRDKHDQGQGFVRRVTSAADFLGLTQEPPNSTPAMDEHPGMGPGPISRAATTQAPQAPPESDKPWYERMFDGAHIASPKEFAQRSGVIPNPGATVDAVKDFLFSPESAQAMRKTLAGFAPHSAMQAAEFATPVVGGAEAILDAGKRVASAAKGEPLPQEKTFPEFTKQDWYDFGTGNASQLVVAALTGKGLFKAGAAPKGPVRETVSPVARPEAQAVSPEPPPVQRVSPETGETFYDYGERTLPEAATASGTVRLYHGSSSASPQAGRDFTTSRQYAEDYAAKSGDDGGTVWYVDVPEGALKTHDEYGQPMTRVIVPDEFADQARPLAKPAEPATVSPNEQTRQVAESPVSTTPGDITPGQQPPADTRPVSLVARSEIGAVGPGERQATSTKNSVTAVERETRGIAPAEESARRDFGTVWDESGKVAQSSPYSGIRLVQELNEKPRPVSDTENAILLRRQIEVQNEHDTAIKAVNDNPGDTTAQAHLDRVRDDLQASYDAAKVAGTETGRGLNARKMLAANDFSLAKMEAETRAVANNGKPLSPKQASDVKALHERIASAEAKIAGYEARDEFNAALKQAKAEARNAPGRIQDFLDQQAGRARERIVARRGRLYADPVGVTNIAHLADEAIIGASHIARGVIKFGEWSQVMVKELGEHITPHLKALYAKAREIASNAAKGKLTPEQREANALAGDKKRIITRTEQVRQKLEAQDFSKPERKPPRMDKEKGRLLYEYAKAKEDYHRGLVEAQRKQRSAPKKVFGAIGETFNLSRALMTSFDLSAVLRQGGFAAMGHPIRALKIFPDMLRAMESERGRFLVNESIRNRPNAKSGLYKQAKLFLSDERTGTSLSKMEEVYASRLAGKIPGIAASERAYTTFLNRLRADSFDALTASLAKRGTPTLAESRAIANFVNVMTGRGELGKHATAAQGLSTVFFAPRYVLSRFQLLAGQPLYGGTLRTRALIAGEYGKTLIGLGAVYAMAKSAGAAVELDPRSTDFGKIKFGDSRIDPLFGLQQPFVLLSREISGKTKTAGGKIEPIRGNVRYGRPNSFDIGTRFLRSKLAPIPGAAVNLLVGKDYAGQPVTPKSQALNNLTPISHVDIYKAMIEQGVTRGTALGLLSLLGMGLQTYNSKKRTPAGVSP